MDDLIIGGFKMAKYSKEDIAKAMQHTNVDPELSRDGVIQLCKDGLEHGFDGVMIQPAWITVAKEVLDGSDVKICTALGYPMTGELVVAKAFQTEKVFELGADELDFAANIGYIKSGMYDEYRDEIAEVVKAADGHVTKIMLEFGMLNQEEKKIAAELALEAGVDYLKNSSGWGKGGKATIEDIKLLKEIAGDKAQVKASGGIRTQEQAEAMLDAGAVLLGSSAGVKIMTGEGSEGNY